MISDLYALESYYGREGGHIDMQQAMKSYGKEQLRAAFKARYVQTKILCCSDDTASRFRNVLWLTDKGRQAARQMQSLYKDSLHQGCI